MKPKKTKQTRIARKIGLLAASTLISCLLLEFAVRIFLGDRIVLFPRFHARAEYGPYTIRRLRPDTTFRHRSRDGSWKFTINSQGFRSAADFQYEKPEGNLRVICLGDSQTQGFECRQDKTFSAVIQRYLSKRGENAEVINAGVSGFSTAEALAFLENEGIRYNPDAVVLGFFANDMDDNIKADLFRLTEEGLANHRFEHIPAVGILDVVDRCPPLRWLSQNSYAYSHLFNTVWEYKKSLLLKEAEYAAATEFAAAQKDEDARLTGKKQQLTEALLERMHSFCESNNVVLVVLDIPQPGKEDQDFLPSIPEKMVQSFKEHSDALILSPEILGDYDGLLDFFVPHGQRHISEATHMLLGAAAAKSILEQLEGRKSLEIAPAVDY
ncbi:MAG: SGNH/GDSL hydrolase family protein [Kiritimatiellia bacterium]